MDIYYHSAKKFAVNDEGSYRQLTSSIQLIDNFIRILSFFEKDDKNDTSYLNCKCEMCKYGVNFDNIFFYRSEKDIPDEFHTKSMNILGTTTVYLYHPETKEFTNSYNVNIYELLSNSDDTVRYAIMSPVPENCTIVSINNDLIDFAKQVHVYNIDNECWNIEEDHRLYKYEYNLEKDIFDRVQYVSDKNSKDYGYLLPLEGDSNKSPYRYMEKIGPYPENSEHNLPSIEHINIELNEILIRELNNITHKLIFNCFRIKCVEYVNEYKTVKDSHDYGSIFPILNPSPEIESVTFSNLKNIFINIITKPIERYIATYMTTDTFEDNSYSIFNNFSGLYRTNIRTAMAIILKYKKLYNDITDIYMLHRSKLISMYEDKETPYKEWYCRYINRDEPCIFDTIINEMDMMKDEYLKKE